MTFLSESKMDSTAPLPAMPKNKDHWDDYLLQIYEIKLTFFLVELKNLFDSGHSKHLDIRQINKDIVNSYTSLVTDVWHTEIAQKLEVDSLDTLKHKDAVNKIKEVINKLVDKCVIMS